MFCAISFCHELVSEQGLAARKHSMLISGAISINATCCVTWGVGRRQTPDLRVLPSKFYQRNGMGECSRQRICANAVHVLKLYFSRWWLKVWAKIFMEEMSLEVCRLGRIPGVILPPSWVHQISLRLKEEGFYNDGYKMWLESKFWRCLALACNKLFVWSYFLN